MRWSWPTLDQLIRELLETATRSDDPAELIDLACSGLIELGLPLWRLSVGIQTLDPTIRAISYVWMRGEGLTRLTTPYVPGPDSDLPYRRSPIYALVEDEETQRHWRLDRGEGCAEIPLLEELRAEGATSYFMHVVRFGGEIAAAVPGVAIAIATDRPGGFTEGELASFVALMPAVGLASYRYMLARVSSAVLGVYLGERTARRVLAGEVRRGTGRTIEAAILLADLRGFTSLAGREAANPRGDLAGRASGGDRRSRGGRRRRGAEVPGRRPAGRVPGRGWHERPEACRRALAAAEQALAATDELNARRRAAGEPELGLDLVLHFGEVVYGNVGAARRLDFTVIGPTVNEASRIEALCDGARPALAAVQYVCRRAAGEPPQALAASRCAAAPARPRFASSAAGPRRTAN